jgi:RNA polymerase sigma factor (TIGR02999 family)
MRRMSANVAPTDITHLLAQWKLGNNAAFEQAIERAMQWLKRMAEQRLRSEEQITLNAQELLHEALIRVMEGHVSYSSRAHFFATASLHMRSVLVDHARSRAASKRGDRALHITLSNIQTNRHPGEGSMALELIALDEALNDLAKLDARVAQTMHLSYFSGLDRQAIAQVQSVSIPTVDRDLRFGKAWLSQRLEHELP